MLNSDDLIWLSMATLVSESICFKISCSNFDIFFKCLIVNLRRKLLFEIITNLVKDFQYIYPIAMISDLGS